MQFRKFIHNIDKPIYYFDKKETRKFQVALAYRPYYPVTLGAEQGIDVSIEQIGKLFCLCFVGMGFGFIQNFKCTIAFIYFATFHRHFVWPLVRLFWTFDGSVRRFSKAMMDSSLLALFSRLHVAIFKDIADQVGTQTAEYCM